ncbi:GNAT family N-acetyltransferase [Gammaproteobacteria bacterium]|nr:GNAT family N-acetyltransferase [Gammaproteobacteria bacterium]
MPSGIDINVRSAELEDLDLIISLIKKLADYGKMVDSFVAEPSDLEEAFFSEVPSAEVIIGEVDGEAAGFAVFYHTFSTWLGKKGIYLDNLFVLPAARGNGLGKALLVNLAKIAVERDCKRMEWQVLDWNIPSAEFYKSLGAAPMEGRSTFRMTHEKIDRLAEL